MASIVHRKDGYVAVKYKDPGSGKWVFEYTGKGEHAETLAERIKFEKEMVENSTARPAAISFFELTQLYIDSRVNMSPSNQKKLATRLESTIFPILGRLPADQITHAALNNYIISRKNGVGPRAAPPSMATIQNELSIIMTIMNWAAYRTQPPIITDNPAKWFNKGKRDYEVIDPPSTAEIEEIIAHAAPHLRRALVLDVMTGVRPGESELFSLRWTDVDLVGNKIAVTCAKKGAMPKRYIPLSTSLRAHLLQWRQEDLRTGAKFLIHYNNRPVRSLKTAWNAAKRRAGITRKLRLYDCRHFFATHLLSLGSDTKTVALLMGHSSPQMILTRYQHINTVMKESVISKLPEMRVMDDCTKCTTKAESKIKKIKQK